MSAYGDLIAGGADFAGCSIYERRDPAGPVYTIEFINREADPTKLRTALTVGPMILSCLAFFASIFIAPELSLWVGAVFVGFVALGLLGALFPPKARYQIILDYGRNLLLVKKRGQTVAQEAGPGEAQFTVEDHPEELLERVQRAQRRQSGVGPKQKQHVLVGWFGVGNAVPRALVFRHEWPKQYSLQGIRACTMWAQDRQRGAQRTIREIEGQAPLGIAPPLD